MKPFAALLILALTAAPAGAAPAAPKPAGEVVPSGPGSTYAMARRACDKQGRKLEMVGAQTNDKYTQVGVTVSYRCGARLPRPARKRW